MRIENISKSEQLIIGGTGTHKLQNDFILNCAAAGIKVNAPYFKGEYTGDRLSFPDELTRLSKELQTIDPKVIHIDLQEIEGKVCEVIRLGIYETDAHKVEELLNGQGTLINWIKCRYI
ncbi:hypothetical protein [Paenibacillus taichungensis]